MLNEIIRLAGRGAEVGGGGRGHLKKQQHRSGERRLRDEWWSDVDGSRRERTPRRCRVRAEELIGDKNPLPT